MNWRDRRGLSLMELLVALALVAVIAGGLATSTNFGVQLLNRTQELQETNPEIALRTRLRQWLGAATPPSRLAGFPTDMSGTSDRVQFTTIAPAPFAPDSAALRITIDAAGADLIVVIEEMDDAADVIARHEWALAADLNGAQISYYTNDAETPGWQNTWDDPARLPSLVRIMGDEGSTPPWPEFTVRLLLGP